MGQAMPSPGRTHRRSHPSHQEPVTQEAATSAAAKSKGGGPAGNVTLRGMQTPLEGPKRPAERGGGGIQMPKGFLEPLGGSFQGEGESPWPPPGQTRTSGRSRDVAARRHPPAPATSGARIGLESRGCPGCPG